MPIKKDFLRSETSLLQTIGRSARNVNATVILYADTVTDSMQNAIDETHRRRAVQEEYNREHNITPATIVKAIRHGIEAEAAAHARANAAVGRTDEAQYITEEYIGELEAEMYAAAEGLEFERAAAIRDRITKLRDSIGKKVGEVDFKADSNGNGNAAAGMAAGFHGQKSKLAPQRASVSEKFTKPERSRCHRARSDVWQIRANLTRAQNPKRRKSGDCHSI